MSERVCHLYDLGRIGHADAEAAQERLLAARREGAICDHLLLLEHDPVVTLGSASDDPADELSLDLLAAAGVEVRRVSRGGRATFHGPGQIVGYPILGLREHRQDLHWYLRSLEQVLITALKRFCYPARRSEGLTGVWVGERKVASIGIAVRSWVTWHGFALNLSCDSHWWQMLDPCGLRPEQMASLADLEGDTPSRGELADSIVECFGEVFDLRMVAKSQTELFASAGF